MFRDAGRVGDRVLDALGGLAPGTPDQTDRLDPQWKALRTQLALEVPGSGTLMVASAVVLIAMAVMPIRMLAREHRPELWAFAGVAMVAYLVFLGYALQRRTVLERVRAARLAEITAWPARQPFAVTGFAAWLVADVPLLDLHAPGEIDAEKLARAAHNIDPAIGVEAIDERTIRLALPPRTRRLNRGSISFGNVQLLERVFQELVLPLHSDGAVENVSMGGLVTPA